MWNEESSIHLALTAAREAGDALVAAKRLGGYEVLVVNDASTDATGAIADELAAADPDHITVVHHDENRGLGGSLKTGLTNATGDLVLYTDADLPCDLLETLPRAVRLLDLYDADIVSAYRHDRTAEGPRRAVYSFAYNLLIRFLFDLRVRDVNFAFKLIRRRVLDNIRLDSEGSFIDVELLVRAHRLGFRTIQFGVDYFPRTRGVSTLSSNATIAKIVREMTAKRPELMAIQPIGASANPEPRKKTGEKLLIVNADDYGLTDAVSRGILKAHEQGIVTSTSVLALAPGFATSGPRLTDVGTIGVGVHLAAVGEDPPLLSASEIPTLVDGRGRLASSWRVFLQRAVRGRIDPDDVRREFAAQIERVRQLGVTIDHLDTHQHLHLWPLVRDVVLDLAATNGIGAVRVPRSTTAVPGLGVNYLAGELARRAGAAGLAAPDWAAGLDEAGRMAGDRVTAALDDLARRPGRAVELSAHPGEAVDPDRDRYRWNYRWGDELEALMSSPVRAAVDDHGFVLGTYADLVPQ